MVHSYTDELPPMPKPLRRMLKRWEALYYRSTYRMLTEKEASEHLVLYNYLNYTLRYYDERPSSITLCDLAEKLAKDHPSPLTERLNDLMQERKELFRATLESL